MVERYYHHYFPYNICTAAYTGSVKEERRISIIKEKLYKQEATKANFLKESTLVQSFLQNFLTTETFQSLSAMNEASELNTIWFSLVTQYQAVNEHIIR